MLARVSTGFQMEREVGVSVHCGVSASKGGSLKVAEAKRTISGSWMRLGCLGKLISVRSVKHM